MSDSIQINSSLPAPSKGFEFSLEPLYALARAVADFFIGLWNALFGDSQKSKPEIPLNELSVSSTPPEKPRPFAINPMQLFQDNIEAVYKKFESHLASAQPKINHEGPLPKEPLGSCISPSLKLRTTEWIQHMLDVEMDNIQLDRAATKKKPEFISPDQNLTRAIKRGYPINVMGTQFQRSTDPLKTDDAHYDEEVAAIKKQLKELVKTHFPSPTLQRAVLAACVWDLVHHDIIFTLNGELQYEKLVPCDDEKNTIEITDGITSSTLHDKRVYISKLDDTHAYVTVQKRFYTNATHTPVEITLTILLDNGGFVSNLNIGVKESPQSINLEVLV